MRVFIQCVCVCVCTFSHKRFIRPKKIENIYFNPLLIYPDVYYKKFEFFFHLSSRRLKRVWMGFIFGSEDILCSNVFQSLFCYTIRNLLFMDLCENESFSWWNTQNTLEIREKSAWIFVPFRLTPHTPAKSDTKLTSAFERGYELSSFMIMAR